MARVRRILSCSLSPNTETDDVVAALAMFFTPWKWNEGKSTKFVVESFRTKYKTDSVYAFNSGRSALLGLLNAFEIGQGDEVIVQAFTCVAVPNSVLWAGATPIYADIDDSYNISPQDVEKKITKKTKAIIVQHTFGIPANLEKILVLCRKYNIYLIEDCAHALGSTNGETPLGFFGDGAFFSFGRDKSLSSVWGGIALIRNEEKYTKPVRLLKKFYDSLQFPKLTWTAIQLLHPIWFFVILPLYLLGFGKVFLFLLQRLRLITFPVYTEEKVGQKPYDFPAKYPNALAYLLINQLKKLDRYTKNRKSVAQVYYNYFKNSSTINVSRFDKDAAYLRYPVRCNNPKKLLRIARASGILLGTWYSNIIDPVGVDKAAIHYNAVDCPKAERAAGEIVNLPTRISMTDADIIASLIAS